MQNNNKNDNDDDSMPLNSEVVWSFTDFKKQVIDAYQTGNAVTEQLVTIGGRNTWKIEFYPNGKDNETENKLYFSITYTETNDQNETVETDAECNYRIINKDENKNYVGKIERQKFKTNASANDASFDKTILNDCKHSCLIGICISQYPIIEQHQNDHKLENVNQTTSLQSTDVNVNGHDENGEEQHVKKNQSLSSTAPSVNADDDLVKQEAEHLY